MATTNGEKTLLRLHYRNRELTELRGPFLVKSVSAGLRLTLMEKETIRKIRDAVRSGKLGNIFTPDDVNRVLGIDWAGTFLPKHRVDNPGRFTELFLRVDWGLYRLK